MSIMTTSPGPYLPHMSPWANIHLGTTRPLIVTEDGRHTLHRAETIRSSSSEQIAQPEALIIHDASSPDPCGVYFILENRAPLNYDDGGSTTIDEGLAIWHIHEVLDHEAQGRRAVRLIRPQVWASHTESLWDGGDPDYYNLMSWSTPKNTRWADGFPSYIDIMNLSEAGDTMTVDIRLPGVFVDQANAGSDDGSQAHPWDSVAEAALGVASSGRNRTIRIAPGTYTESGVPFSFRCTLVNSAQTGTVYIGP